MKMLQGSSRGKFEHLLHRCQIPTAHPCLHHILIKCLLGVGIMKRGYQMRKRRHWCMLHPEIGLWSSQCFWHTSFSDKWSHTTTLSVHNNVCYQIIQMLFRKCGYSACLCGHWLSVCCELTRHHYLFHEQNRGHGAGPGWLFQSINVWCRIRMQWSVPGNARLRWHCLGTKT